MGRGRGSGNGADTHKTKNGRRNNYKGKGSDGNSSDSGDEYRRNKNVQRRSQDNRVTKSSPNRHSGYGKSRTRATSNKDGNWIRGNLRDNLDAFPKGVSDYIKRDPICQMYNGPLVREGNTTVIYNGFALSNFLECLFKNHSIEEICGEFLHFLNNISGQGTDMYMCDCGGLVSACVIRPHVELIRKLVKREERLKEIGSVFNGNHKPKSGPTGSAYSLPLHDTKPEEEDDGIW